MNTEKPRYTNAEAFRQAITNRAKFAAKNDPTIPTEKRLRQFAYNRFLARIFSEESSEWVLKGGVALLARLPDARHSRDVDLASHASSVEATVDELELLLARDLGDFFEFRIQRSTRLLTGLHSGISIPLIAYVGIKELVRFNVDIVVGANITREPDVIEPHQPIDIPGIIDFPWRAYPLVDHIADKFAAIAETHGDQRRASNRYRDLVDLTLIATSSDIDAAALRLAIQSEFRFRGLAAITPFTVPDVNE